ncbi:DUF4251 domain-containing protein [Sabulilitoribacter arenilitoris]|uniref:DUF4251 domain-containing protein n=1 Tax=Wocania arenilitoris TaxID=2044858 RepID=A0AAE3EPF1_9FLAO|nr:DUF4251 domain-containing protein [Wocania arenilitoris]MCF7568602.1 DUF4251 domain-containing protein [Wocania arenilitoris]
MKSLQIIAFAIMIIFFSCKATNLKASNAQIKMLKNLVESRRFKIESDWAYPQTTMAMQQVLNTGLLQPGSTSGAINLITNPNYLTISADSITSYLPYFGERQINVSYGGNDAAIQLNSNIENYKITNGKRGSYIISCNAKSKSEYFNIIIELYPNLKSNIRLISASRNLISYSGHVKSSD